MNIVTERKDLVRFARRARFRMGLVRGVEASLRALFWALCAAILGVLAAKLLGLPIPPAPAAAALAAVAALAGLVALFVPPLDLLEAAGAVDERAGWKERLSSALALKTSDHPMEKALLEDVRARLKGQSVARLFPFRAPRELRWAPAAAGALAAACWLMPRLDLLGIEARETAKNQEKEEIRLAVEKLEKSRKSLEKSERPADKVKEAIQKMDALAQEFQKSPPQDKRDALAQVSKLSDDIKKLKDELSKSGALAEKLQKAASEKPGDAGELGRLLAEGKVAEAAQELAKLRTKLQDGSLSKAEREKLAKQFDALREKLSKNKDLSEIEKKLAEAMRGLDDGDEKGLDSLQQELAELQNDLEGQEQLAEALKDLERLADALAKEKKKCSSCGKSPCEGKGGCPGGEGLGKGDTWDEGDDEEEGGAFGKRGQGEGGEAPETPTDFATEREKVKGKLGKGTTVGAYFMKGDPPVGEAAAQYADVQRVYAEEALDALQHQKVPAAQRDYVRDYFDAIRLEQPGKSK